MTMYNSQYLGDLIVSSFVPVDYSYGRQCNSVNETSTNKGRINVCKSVIIVELLP